IDAALGYSFRLYVDLKDRGVPVDDIVLMPMADYGLKLYGNAIIINPKFAADKPEAVRAFLHAFLKGLKDIVRRPVDAVDAVVRRDEALKKEVELERLRMAIRDNIVTPEVKANGYGAVDYARLGTRSIKSGWSTPSRRSPRRRTFSTPRSCRPPTSAGCIEFVAARYCPDPLARAGANSLAAPPVLTCSCGRNTAAMSSASSSSAARLPACRR